MKYLSSDSMIIMPAEAAAMYPYYDLTVTLMIDLDEPVEPIWRRFLLSGTASLFDLHKAIQVACGWQDYHLYHFQEKPGYNAKVIAGAPEEIDEWLEDEDPPPSAKTVKLSKAIGKKPGKTIIYRYDFGDDWEHEVKVNEIVTLPYKFKRTLLDGARAFPPEDCGSGPGYEECVAVFRMAQKEAVDTSGKVAWLGDKLIEQDEELLLRRNWLGNWNPEAFDLTKAKRKFDR